MIRILLSCVLILMSSEALAQHLDKLSAGRAQGITAKFMDVANTFFEKPDPLADRWDEIPLEKVTLLPQNITAPSVFQTSIASLEVKAMHNGDHLAILLTWKDPKSDKNISLDHFSDACAIQFPLKEALNTSPFMGNKGFPVEIIHWKAIWQNDIEHGYQKVEDLYPNTWRDSDLFGKTIAIDAKNPVSQTKRSVPVEELIAEGFGTLTTQEHQNANGNGVWKDGEWHVVFTRPLKSVDKQDPVLYVGEPSSIAFALWEGGHKDIGARKNYAPWMTFLLETK